MKISKILALLLALVMILSLCACGEKKESDEDSEKKDDKSSSQVADEDSEVADEAEEKEFTFVGDWAADMDITEALGEMLDMLGAEGLESSKLVVPVNFSFGQDGSYKVEVNKDDFLPVMKDWMGDMLEKILKAQGIEMSLEEYLETSGMTLDDILEEAFTDESIDEMTGEMNSTGKYKVEEGKLYMSLDGDDEISTDEYIVFEAVSNDEIKFVNAVSGEAEAEELGQMIFPIILKRK